MKNVYLLFFLLSFTTLSWAHDYWLEADKFQVAVGEDLVVHLYVGHNFDAEIERKLQKDMTSKFILVTKEKSIDLLNEFSEGNFPIVKRKLDLAGPTLLVMERNFASIELEKDKFVKYLKEEQGEHAKLHNNEGKQRERYARCIKSLVVCGDKPQGDIHKKVFGQKLEIILLQNPYTTSLGGSIEAKILFDGKPLANKMVMAQNKDAEGKINTLKAKTNSEGIAKFTINHKGVWIVRLVHILPLVDEDYDWESFWASYSFYKK